MVDRSYLPFQSAREYQDTGMQKWMGFFLSEHTTALSDDNNHISYLSELSVETKLLLLSQLYSNQLPSCIVVLENKKKVTVIGTIQHLSQDYILVKTKESQITVSLEQILSIRLDEEVLDESA
ncbi:hypothetical protein [Streptococcus loxodontisalivarius]|uniref:YolD-like protein n=1 Tax=Streptococcus loxodontisalivarius TaxID=1349415 RepID=A0ABS2PPU7_9STRE|nr:hypothetical protein [Streptococcus loxodontisalivarius]MBM7642057.1 hypothetical protein [Streptococcus loxodontisalivarius]